MIGALKPSCSMVGDMGGKAKELAEDACEGKGGRDVRSCAPALTASLSTRDF